MYMYDLAHKVFIFCKHCMHAIQKNQPQQIISLSTNPREELVNTIVISDMWVSILRLKWFLLNKDENWSVFRKLSHTEREKA